MSRQLRRREYNNHLSLQEGRRRGKGNVIPSFLFPKLNEVDHSVGVAAGLVLIREKSKSNDIFLITISLAPTLTSIY